LVGLFIFNSSIFHTATHNFIPSVSYTVKENNLWHCRMGHPSDERLHVLKSQYPFVSADKTHMCDICNRAKQRKLPFTLSTSHTTAIFDIIHVDI